MSAQGVKRLVASSQAASGALRGLPMTSYHRGASNHTMTKGEKCAGKVDKVLELGNGLVRRFVVWFGPG